MRTLSRATYAALGLGATLAFTGTAAAEDTVVPQPTTTVVQPAPAPAVVQQAPPERERETISEKGGPSRSMLSSGIVVFGVSYGAGAIVGLSSDRDSDHHLVVPFAGPWMDLADREACGSGHSVSCDSETTNKVLLVTDGVFQAVGGLLVIGAFFNPEQRTVTKTSQSHLLVAPTVGQNSFGLTAVGVF